MTTANWKTQAVWEGTSLKVMARLVDIDGDYVTQAGIASISYRVVEDGTDEIIEPTALTVSDVIFDTLQTNDSSWTVDATGYNFKCVLPPATFPTGGVTNYIPITFTDTSSPTAVVSVLGIKTPVIETYVDTPA